MMKLKNVQTGEIRDVVSISQDKDMITGLYFSGNRWASMIIQTWDCMTLSLKIFWVPAKPGLDY